jgi:uncharacterized protein
MAIFLALAFGIAWSCQLPVYAGGLDGPLALALLGIGGLAPSIAALVVTRGAVWRETWRKPRALWPLAVAAVGPSAIAVLAAAVSGGGLVVGVPYIPSVILPPIGEELGWRGYLQPTFDRKLGSLSASLAVGLIWAFWHLPTSIGSLDRYPLFALSIIASSVIIGWLWRASGRTALVGIIAHAALNLGILHGPRPAAVIVLVSAAIAVALRCVYASHRSLADVPPR